VVVYTSGDDPYLVRRAIAGGALSIVRKSAPPEDLVEAVLAASDGATCPTPDWAAALDADEDFVASRLSDLEARILAHYASGERSGSVARALNVSKNTVNTYIARIREKYRESGRPAESRVDLFRRAAEDGLLSYFD
jgi:response regulator receiver